MVTQPATRSVLLLRHGETEWNQQGRCLGWTDLPLNEAGKRQADAVAHHLATRRIAAITTSSLQRARMTAQAIASLHQITPIPHDGLREIHHGTMEGVPFPDLPVRFPEQHDAWEHDPGRLSMPEGETVAELQARALAAFHASTTAWLDQNQNGGPHGDLVLVAHNLSIASIICHLKNEPLSRLRAHMLENCGYHELRYSKDGWVVAATSGTPLRDAPSVP